MKIINSNLLSNGFKISLDSNKQIEKLEFQN